MSAHLCPWHRLSPTGTMWSLACAARRTIGPGAKRTKIFAFALSFAPPVPSIPFRGVRWEVDLVAVLVEERTTWRALHLRYTRTVLVAEKGNGII